MGVLEDILDEARELEEDIDNGAEMEVEDE